jgi:hypothetical protein
MSGTCCARIGFQIGTGGTIPERAITAYTQTHPDREY